MIGDDFVGKTVLVRRFIRNSYMNNPVPTLGADYESRTIRVLDQQYRLGIWDTAGSEQYRSLNVIYCKQADAIMLLYDTTRRETFDDIE